MRSNYRRRLKQINEPNSRLIFEKIPCSEFTTAMYQQYLSVFMRSNGKLEMLSFDFFKNLPEEFILKVCKIDEAIIGWNIALSSGNIYYFFLGGIDYKYNKIYNTYLRLLSSLIEDGINKNAEIIELGQTAEIAKMRMGGIAEARFMEAHHSNLLFHKVLKISSPMLSYKRKLENTKAFKDKPYENIND